MINNSSDTEITRRRHDKWLVPSVLALVGSALLQFGVLIWWGSSTDTKAKVAYEFAQVNHDIADRMLKLEACSSDYQDLPIRVLRLEEETDKLQRLPSEVAGLIVEVRTLQTYMSDIRQDQRDITANINELKELVLTLHRNGTYNAK